MSRSERARLVDLARTLADLKPGLPRRRRLPVRLLALLALLALNLMLVFVFNDALGRVGGNQPLEPPGSPQARIGARSIPQRPSASPMQRGDP